MIRGRLVSCAMTALLVSLSGCAAFRSSSHTSAVAKGRARFHERDLGSPRSTGIPYALWLAMMERYPERLGADWTDFSRRFGLLPERTDRGSLPTGFVLVHNGLSGTDFLMTNCSFCHEGSINGQRIEGLGNKWVRLNAMENAIMKIASSPSFSADRMVPVAEENARRFDLAWGWRTKLVTKKAIGRLKHLAAEHVDLEGGPGRATPIEFAKVRCKVPITRPIGYVKIPAVWMYRKRQSFGFDGSIFGDRAMALSAVEFNKGMPSRHIVQRTEQWEDLYEYLASLRPPSYPRAVDAAKAGHGQSVFAANCSGCHGDYSSGASSYDERVIPIDVVDTDRDRMVSVSSELVRARTRSLAGTRLRLEGRGGYVPPPLDGIWCRGPYLHNGSVPTLADLLRVPEQRPVLFYIGTGTPYDLHRIGISYEETRTPDGRRAGLRHSSEQFEFDTRQPGNGNGGHPFGTDLAVEDREALIEYLKTL